MLEIPREEACSITKRGLRSKAISKPFYIRRKTEGASLEFCMIAHDQRYALSINILLLPLLTPGAIMAQR